MNNLCHRCSGELTGRDGAASFCPHCGATQLYLLDHLLEDAPRRDTTGAPAPPGSGPGTEDRQVEWQAAIRSAAFVGAVAAFFCVASLRFDIFGLLGFIWIASGSVIAIGMYHSQRPAAYMDTAVGARIGVVVGAVVAAALGLALALAGVVTRYALHGMGAFDRGLSTLVQTVVAQAQAQSRSQGQTMPDWLIALISSPQYRAASMLAGLGMLIAGVMVLSTLGGAFAGFLRTRPRALEG